MSQTCAPWRKRIGVMVGGTNVPGPPGPDILADIEKAEEMGIPAAWLVCGGSGIDSITLFAAAAVRTQHILFGTAIVQTFPRHPVLMAQQAQVLAQLAPGRFRLGIGTGHRPNMESYLWRRLPCASEPSERVHPYPQVGTTGGGRRL